MGPRRTVGAAALVFLTLGAAAEVPARAGDGPTGLASVGDSVLYLAGDGGAVALWRSDGSASGTRRVRRFEMYSSGGFVDTVEGLAFFVTGFVTRYGSGGGDSHLTLWATDGTERGTVELDSCSAPFYESSVPQGIRQPGPGSCAWSVIGRSGLFFVARSATGLDGGEPRAELLSWRRQDAAPSSVRGAPAADRIVLLALESGRLSFSVRNELWSSDGETAARLLVDDGRSGYLYARRELEVGERVFHARADAEHGEELWLRQPDGLTLLRDINPGINSSDPWGFVELRGRVFFSASTLEHGRELWATDGTPEGTVMVRDIVPGPEDSSPERLTPVDGYIVFMTRYGELWRTDGTPEGTAMLSASLTRSPRDSRPAPELGGRAFFSARPEGTAGGYELYAGDRSGLRLVRDINPGAADSDPRDFARLGGALIFTADDGMHGRELWVTDGTEGGTRLLPEIAPGSAGIEVVSAAVFRGRLWFVAAGGEGDPALHLTDGSAAGTEAVATFPRGSSVSALTGGGDELFWLVTVRRQSERRSENSLVVQTATRTELWRSDGTPSGSSAFLAWERTDVDVRDLRAPPEQDDWRHQIP